MESILKLNKSLVTMIFSKIKLAIPKEKKHKKATSNICEYSWEWDV